MSEPGVFVFVRDGEKKIYADRWASVLLYRELLWGPEELEKYASQFHSIEIDEAEYTEEGALVDYDKKTLSWSKVDKLRIPVVESVYKKLLAVNWPGFEFLQTDEIQIHDGPDPDAEHRDDLEFYEHRSESVEDAGRTFHERDEDEDEEVDDGPLFEEGEQVAWITIISRNANVRHRVLDEIPGEFFKPQKGLAKKIGSLEPAQVPAEKRVYEGAVIDIPNRTLSIYGQSDLETNLSKIDANWGDWKTNWLPNGYADHCKLTASEGKFASEAEALAEFIPVALTTKRMDMSTILGAMGGGLKKNAAKAAGCLYFLVCIPILIFAFFSGMWTAALITVLVTAVVFFVVFKVLENKVKNKFNPLTAKDNQDPEFIPAAGPLDKDERESRLDEMLTQAGLPSLSEIRVHCGEGDEDLDFLQ